MMTGWSITAILTPQMLAALRTRSADDAVRSLVAGIDPAAFQANFGAPVAELDALVATKTVTIARLLEISPKGTIDPTPFLYDSTFYTVSGILAVAAIANGMISKVDAKYLEAEEAKEPPAEEPKEPPAAESADAEKKP
jgi:hypothetical protein